MIPLTNLESLDLACAAPVYVHPQSLVETTRIGAGTRILAFAHVCAGARIGRDCTIGDHSVVGANVRIGHRVVVEPGVYLPPGSQLEDDVVVGGNVSIECDGSGRGINVRSGARIGAGAVLHEGIEIGAHAQVPAGTVVLHSLPARRDQPIDSLPSAA